MASSGQRFRRRALRRGYKVDEVDSFLDRVEATLNGDPVAAPVSAQEVHDVVFRVRFGGYDEWQVDLHLDRVERQLAEMEERAPSFGGQLPMRDRHGVSQQPMGPPPMQPRPAGPGMGSMAGGYGQPVPPPSYGQGAGRYDQPAYSGAPGGYGGYPSDGGYGGFEPGRHGRVDMTAEIRMPEQMPMSGAGYGAGSPAAMSSPAAMGSPIGMGSPVGMGGPASGPEVQRIDQLRRTFQPRRFGSGYDIGQVDRLFEGVLAAMSGRGSIPITNADLDPGQFSLVPGGYFEAEVDAALKEVRDVLRRR